MAYIGHHRMLAVGDEGIALDIGVSGTHVRWITGSRAGSVDLVRSADLVPSENTSAVAIAQQVRKDALADGWALADDEGSTSHLDDDELGWI